MSRFANHLKRGAVVLLCAGAGVAQAFETTLGGVPIKIDNLVSVGALMRLQDRDSSLIGKTNVTPGLCMIRTAGGDAESGPSRNLDENQYAQGQIPAVCATSNRAAIDQFNASPGAFSPNGDGGNMNFDQYDVVHGTAKLTTDVNVDIFDFHIFARGLTYYDVNYANMKDRHFDATLTPAITEFSKAGREEIGVDFQMLDYFVTRNFNVWDREISFRVGNQVLNWGESAFLIPNSLNSISPPNQALLRIPGFDVKELLQPVGMAYVSAQLMEGVNLESFYQYQYKSVVIDPVGSYFSTSDTLGPGGNYAMLSFGRAAEDPGFRTNDPYYEAGYRGFYRAIDTCSPSNFNPPTQPTPCIDSAGLLGSTSSRTIYRDRNEEEKRKPSEGGQYGFALKYFADWLNGGTELAAYYANYHSRFPTVSAFAAKNTCITDAASIASPAGCGLANFSQILQGNLTGVGSPATREPLPVDTVRLVVEYPEDVRVLGLSFNTTIGDFAFSGEYTYRPNLPMQVHSTDVIYAALQPAFPEEDVTLIPGALVIPGRRSAVPDFLMTNYRGQTVTAGQYIQGYERMKQSQAEITFIRIFGGDNWFGASQITALLEIGDTYVHGFPDLSELQFQGAGVDTHISAGADESLGINPRDVRVTPDNFRSNVSAPGSRQNPTAHADTGGFGTQNSWGYRAVVLTRYDDSMFGANFEILTGLFHDVGGVGPGIGQNFVAGRKVILAGLRFDYLSRWNGEIRYTAYTGGGKRDPIRDRDNLMVSLGYQF
jgi:hypothetical protein